MKYFLATITTVIMLYVSAWLFNHINPWVGILSYTASVPCSYYIFKKLLKSKTK